MLAAVKGFLLTVYREQADMAARVETFQAALEG